MTEAKGGTRGVVPLLWLFAFLSYLLRTNMSVAQQYMAREMGWTDQQIGFVFTSFLVGYTLFQVPAGILGDRFGARIVLAVSGLWWGLLTLLTGLLPGLIIQASTLAFLSVLLVRFLLGIAEASTYPVIMTAVRDYFALSRHAFINALIITGSTCGAAFAPPLVAYIMVDLGWRATFYALAILPLVAAILWWRRAGTARVRTSSDAVPLTAATSGSWRRLATQPDVIFLCLSYLLYCYAISIFVYWLFKYLVDVRHLSILNSSWATSLPWLAASAMIPIVGWTSGRLSRERSNLYGRRTVAVLCLVLASFLMFVVASSTNIQIALGAIALSVALLFSTESSYWSMAIELAPADAGAASGLMNLMGNGGGILATSLVPVLVRLLGWYEALLSGSVLALLAAVFWFCIRESKRVEALSSTAMSVQ